MKTKTIVKFLLSIMMLTTFISPLQAYNVAASVRSYEQTLSEDSFKQLSQESMVLLLQAVDEMPEDMISRAEQHEIDNYMLSKGINLKFNNEYENRSFWGCVGAITWAVGTVALGVTMIAKIKNFIAAAGGVQAAATALMAIAKNGWSQENINRFGVAMIEIGSTILGIKAIKDECFS